jgi:hypothetical protein
MRVMAMGGGCKRNVFVCLFDSALFERLFLYQAG